MTTTKTTGKTRSTKSTKASEGTTKGSRGINGSKGPDSAVERLEVANVLLGEYANGIWCTSMVWRTRGTEVSVNFDGKRVLAREESKGDVVGFYHTHPEGFLEPSGRDDRTMDAWCFCFGKPILCVIETRRGPNGWIYEYGVAPKKVSRVQRFGGGILVAIL
jgi:hypothetical protein